MTSPPKSSAARRVPELLAPAGDWECAKAAVENGADAIYFGLERFNARMRAHNFTVADLPELMAFLHLRGVKGYVTFNTLVFEDELGEAGEFLRAIIAAGVDAAIVQDVGIARMIRALSPDFPIHASTQMTISSAAGVEFARDLGCNLVVLARECSIDEISRIRRASPNRSDSKGDEPRSAEEESLPLEVFVHGALCVAYSGQCLTSEALGGRSANRGECAQACRMPYELIVDDKRRNLGDRRYLLSPQDLAGIEALPDLVRAGVASLKIEGRLKAPEYVANITRVYREALDKLAAASRGGTNHPQRLSSEDRYNLEMAFSRGLHTGWLRGIDNQSLAHARFAKKRGVFLGFIQRIDGQTLTLAPEAPLKAGDGVVIDTGTGDDHEQGGRVFSIDLHKGLTRVRFRDGQIDPRRVKPGDRLWKTSDPELEKRVRSTYAGDQPKQTRPIHFAVRGAIGTRMSLSVRDEDGRMVEVASEIELQLATNRPLNDESLTKQLGRLGGSPFRFATLDNRLKGDVILPVSELNRLRREAVEKLETLRRRPLRWELRERADRSIASTDIASPDSVPRLIALVRTLPQLEAALAEGLTTIYCDFENPKTARNAVRIYRERHGARTDQDAGIFIAPPRIFKTGEEGVLRAVLAGRADGYLIRNHEGLRFFAGERRIGDFPLNVANSLTADHFLTNCGLETVTASYDLNAAQLEGLLRSAPAHRIEITIHQHMPMFHMEHCVFCAFMSDGRDHRDCGRPCDRHDVKLRDRVRMEHPLKADVGCRNTVFNSQAQTGSEYVRRFVELGARRFRVEFLNDSPEQVRETLDRYRRLLDGEIDGSELWRELKLKNQLGVTRGQLAGS